MQVHHKRHRRVTIDIFVLFFAIAGILGVIIGHFHGSDDYPKVKTLSGADALEGESGGEASLTQGAPGVVDEQNTKGDESALATSSVSDSPTLIVSDKGGSTTQEEPLLLDTDKETNSSSHPPSLRFEDVTTTRYENSRLGFVMEIPDGWTLRYEHADEIAFAGAVVGEIASIDDMRKYPNAMWVVVGRSCESTDATSTIFAAVEGGEAPTRVHYACVPPLRISLGLRSDVPDLTARQSFLLNLARTIYPIVGR